MFRVLAIGTSVIILFLAGIHKYLGGLIIGYHNDGSTWYSNELLSSGNDDSLLVLIGFGSFIASLLFYLAKYQASQLTYYVNTLFLWCMLLLANLDTSLVNSIKLGDYILGVMLLIVHIPIVYHLTSGSMQVGAEKRAKDS